jgi:hypothetical protein
MAQPFTAHQISREFWALLHRMGLPKEIVSATIKLEIDAPVIVTAGFYLTEQDGELKLVEDAIASASADFVFVRADELADLKKSLAAHRVAGKQPGHYDRPHPRRRPGCLVEVAAARELLGDRPHLIVAANLAIIHWTGRLDGAASLHPDRLPGWIAAREGNTDFRIFVPNVGSGIARAEALTERWPGSSGLFATQAALGPMNASGAILCGVPMDQDAGHFAHPGPWARVTSYRKAFEAAHKAVGHRIRSMGGWTQDLFGAPDADWLAQGRSWRRAAAPQPAIRPHREDAHVRRRERLRQHAAVQRPRSAGRVPVGASEARRTRLLRHRPEPSAVSARRAAEGDADRGDSQAETGAQACRGSADRRSAA